jgi:hypothetical protein
VKATLFRLRLGPLVWLWMCREEDRAVRLQRRSPADPAHTSAARIPMEVRAVDALLITTSAVYFTS